MLRNLSSHDRPPEEKNRTELKLFLATVTSSACAAWIGWLLPPASIPAWRTCHNNTIYDHLLLSEIADPATDDEVPETEDGALETRRDANKEGAPAAAAIGNEEEEENDTEIVARDGEESKADPDDELQNPIPWPSMMNVWSFSSVTLKLAEVHCWAKWMAVCVCKVNGPERRRETPCVDTNGKKQREHEREWGREKKKWMPRKRSIKATKAKQKARRKKAVWLGQGPCR